MSGTEELRQLKWTLKWYDGESLLSAAVTAAAVSAQYALKSHLLVRVVQR